MPPSSRIRPPLRKSSSKPRRPKRSDHESNVTLRSVEVVADNGVGINRTINLGPQGPKSSAAEPANQPPADTPSTATADDLHLLQLYMSAEEIALASRAAKA